MRSAPQVTCSLIRSVVVKDKQFVMMKCEDVAHIVPIPLTNEEAYNNFLRNRTKKENKVTSSVRLVTV